MRSPRYLAPRTSPTSARRVPTSPLPVRRAACCASTHFDERVAAARIGEIAEHLDDLLGLEPLGLLGLGLDAVEREHEALAADAVAERLEEFLAAVLVGVLERLEQRAARAVSSAILPRPLAASRPTSGSGSLTSLTSVLVHFGSALRESTVATSWRTLGLWSSASLASSSSETRLGEQLGSKRRAAAEALDLA